MNCKQSLTLITSNIILFIFRFLRALNLCYIKTFILLFIKRIIFGLKLNSYSRRHCIAFNNIFSFNMLCCAIVYRSDGWVKSAKYTPNNNKWKSLSFTSDLLLIYTKWKSKRNEFIGLFFSHSLTAVLVICLLYYLL